ncbi:Exosome complex component RRP42 [Eumeta japonica]|uniref:Ribosomal RNA-processing protein 42 n=1 Tax=Eumeta variegata TaxID=151549 RepID=A0A4C1TG37_EUMVA|nr:Exosome complex component RRP42 [Eumeta japonica]
MELETDVVSHASGSARLRLANTDILVGVKTEIDVPKPENPAQGKIEFFCRLILESGGNLCDAVSVAVKALFNTRIPFVKVALMDGGNIDLQLSDDPYDCKLLDIGSAPLLVTLCKIGDKCVVDPTAEEESCSIVSLIVGITGNPKFYQTEKENEQSFDGSAKCSTIDINGPGSVHPKTLNNAINQGMEAAKALDEALGRTLLRERKENQGFKKQSYGFLK